MKTDHAVAPPAQYGARRGARQGRAAFLTRAPGLFLTTLALLLLLFPGIAERLQLEAGPLTLGKPWRLLTSHLVHWSYGHALWDGIALAALDLALPGSWMRRRWAGYAAAAVAIPLAVQLLQPDLERYRGLSGLACVPFGMLVSLHLRTRLRPVALAFGLAFACKTLFELSSGSAVFVDSEAAGFVTVPLAHLVGASCGAFFGHSGSREQDTPAATDFAIAAGDRDALAPRT